MARKKDCLGCDQAKKGTGDAVKNATDWSKGAPSKTRVGYLVRRFGATGVLRIMSLHFLSLYEQQGDEHLKTTSVLLRNFEDTLRRRVYEMLPPHHAEETQRRIDAALESIGIKNDADGEKG